MRRVLIYLTLLAVIAWHYEANAAQLHLTWTDNSNNEDGFKIERKKGASGTFKQIAVLGGNVSSYTDKGLASGTTYCYRVRAFKRVRNSEYTKESCVTTKQNHKPTSVSKLTVGSYKVVRLTSVYSQPTGESQRVAIISPGTKVLVIDVQGNWLEIRSKHGRPPGFIKRDSVTPMGGR